MVREFESKMNTTGIAQEHFADSDAFTIVKSAFLAWLSERHSKQHEIDGILVSLDEASEQLIRRKLSYEPLWEITNHNVFADIYKKALNDKLFRVTDRKTYMTFIKAGQLYRKFLKSKPDLHKETVILKDNNQTIGGLTIKEAVIYVLKIAQCGMAAEEIYEAIIKDGLYSFAAQNPVNVVRNTIEYACENSGYSKKNTKLYFRFERNADGKKIYYLLPVSSSANVIPQINVPAVTQDEPSNNAENWGIKSERGFQAWLEKERYAQKTVDNYRRAVSQIFRNYPIPAQKVFYESGNRLEAIRKFIDLLNSDDDFVTTNSTRHNQFTAALAALERYYASGCDENTLPEVQIERVIETPVNEVNSYLDGIIDLEEGKTGIRQILAAHFQSLYGYSNINILWNSAQDNLSMFLNDNAINNADDLWRFMQHACSGEYVISNPHIWKTRPDYPQSYVGVIINLARQLGGTVTREQIDQYFARIKQGSPINATIIRQGLLMFYANKHFILWEAVNLTNEGCTEMTKSLDRLFKQEKVSYIVLRDITEEWFSSLPVIKGGIKWTALLLQEVMRLRPAIGYRVIFSGLDGQALDTLGAAIVPSKSEINSFADVVHHHCYEREILGKRMVTEDLRTILRDAGMLEGNELIYNLHKALRDYRFAFTDENRMVKILER